MSDGRSRLGYPLRVTPDERRVQASICGGRGTEQSDYVEGLMDLEGIVIKG